MDGWMDALNSLVNGQLSGLVNGQLSGLVNGQLSGLVNGQLSGLVNVQLSGLVIGQLTKTERPRAAGEGAAPERRREIEGEIRSLDAEKAQLKSRPALPRAAARRPLSLSPPPVSPCWRRVQLVRGEGRGVST